jgi:L-lactate dehydrogenase (cytochrome)
VLYEIRSLRPDLFDKIDIMIDGGIRSGADVVKAVALGAKAVGIGRPILYANGTHGQQGVQRVLESKCQAQRAAIHSSLLTYHDC